MGWRRNTRIVYLGLKWRKVGFQIPRERMEPTRGIFTREGMAAPGARCGFSGQEVRTGVYCYAKRECEKTQGQPGSAVTQAQCTKQVIQDILLWIS